MAQGRSLELFFVDGNPSGMQTAEVFNWTGHVLYFPRTQIVQALARPAARHTGVYVLLGADEAGPRAYVGEGEDIAARIRSHDLAKDFWTHAALITTQANNLHKAHVKYLESRLIEDARRIGRMPLDNANTPARPGLSEAARANMEEFLETLFIVLPALRIDMFEERARPVAEEEARLASAPVSSWEGAEFHLSAPRIGIEATAKLVDGDFVVDEGSLARGEWVGVESGYTGLYNELVEAGVLRRQGAVMIFAQAYAFASPSAAASVIQGRSASGTLEWKTPEGKTYKEWEATMLAALPQEE
jgi:hypothetical protein